MAATTHPTHLTAHPAKAMVMPKQQDPVRLMLRSGKGGVAGEASHFKLRSAAGSSSATWSHWSTVKATAGSAKGRYTVKVTLPASVKKGHSEKYQVRFTGNSAKHLAGSHSNVFTVKAS